MLINKWLEVEAKSLCSNLATVFWIHGARAANQSLTGSRAQHTFLKDSAIRPILLKKPDFLVDLITALT
ncbi:MAG TPA: hypothetical protein VLL54_11125 [Pyrinomonadaceae bacterium]|nr:hypothetical protein [Pyrinomonadaceae bacterium]